MNAATNIQSTPENTHIAVLGGERVPCHVGNFHDVTKALMLRHPTAGIPSYETVATPAPVVVASPARPLTAAGDPLNESGRARAMADELTAVTNGFAPRPPVYAIGTAVNELGVENARRSQLEHEAKPLAIDVARGWQQQVLREERRDLEPVLMSQTSMLASGKFVVDGSVYPVSEDAFRAFASRAIPARSAGAYLADCPHQIRAANWNVWSDQLRDEDRTHVLRTRLEGDERTIFAVVSEKYAAFDADLVAAALAQSFPADARGSLDYDGMRYRVEGLWHSDVAPEEFVAGEIFKAGVIVRGADDGSQSIRVQSVIWRNLCRNLIILDNSIGVDIRLRHMGSVTELARKFREAFARALTSVSGFRNAWGKAMQERDAALVARSAGTTSHDITGMPVSAVLPGLFNGILERELVAIPGRKRDAIVDKLLDMHRQDERAEQYGVSRASIVNAFTRYAHVVESPFVADEIREGAGRLLVAKRHATIAEPLPYLAI